MKCPNCQSEVPDKFKFCPECGASVPGLSSESDLGPRDVSFGDMRTQADGRFVPNDADRSMGDMQTTMGPGHGSGPVGPGTPLTERYELLDEIGQGGFAKVWKAKDKRLGRIVAIKRLLSGKMTGEAGEQTLARFRREAQTIAQLNHRNVLAVYDHDHDDEGDYIVMEYIASGTLADFLKARGGRLEVQTALQLVRCIAQGLAYAHRKGLVHRDIKPANILLSKEGEECIPKIADFGLARGGSETEVSMTGYGMGTPSYMPPEQRRDAKNVNHTADIYALGKILYHLVTGDHPDNVDPEHIPKIKGLKDLIYKCIKSNPEERFFSADELVQALTKCEDVHFKAGKLGAMVDGVASAFQRMTRKSAPVADKPCPACGALNVDGVKFCVGCGGELIRRCPECGKEQVASLQFCGGCGTDMPMFLKWQEEVQALEKAANEKSWSTIIKNHELLPAESMLPGTNGRAMLNRARQLNDQAAKALQRIASLKSQLADLAVDANFREREKVLVELVNLAPHNEEVESQLKAVRHHIEEDDWLRVQKETDACKTNDDDAGVEAAYTRFIQSHPSGKHADQAHERRNVARKRILRKQTVAQAVDYFIDGLYSECANLLSRVVKEEDFKIETTVYRGRCSGFVAMAREKALAVQEFVQSMEEQLARRKWRRALESADAALDLSPSNEVAGKGKRRALRRYKIRRGMIGLTAVTATGLLMAGAVMVLQEYRSAEEFGTLLGRFEDALGSGEFPLALTLGQELNEWPQGRFKKERPDYLKGLLPAWQSRQKADDLFRQGVQAITNDTERNAWVGASGLMQEGDAKMARQEFAGASALFDSAQEKYAGMLESRGVAEEMQRSSVSKMDEAIRRGGTEYDAGTWAAALSEHEQSQELKARGLYDDAVAGFERAIQAFEYNAGRSESMLNYRQAQREYEDVLAEADQSLLDRYGGETWVDARRFAALASESHEDLAMGRQQYQSAAELLRESVRKAHSLQQAEEEERKREERLRQQAMDEQKRANMRKMQLLSAAQQERPDLVVSRNLDREAEEANSDHEHNLWLIAAALTRARAEQSIEHLPAAHSSLTMRGETATLLALVDSSNYLTQCVTCNGAGIETRFVQGAERSASRPCIRCGGGGVTANPITGARATCTRCRGSGNDPESTWEGPGRWTESRVQCSGCEGLGNTTDWQRLGRGQRYVIRLLNELLGESASQ